MIDTKTNTDVMSCADALRMETTSVLGQGAAQTLDALGHALGMGDAVKGTVTAHVEWHSDTRDLRQNRLVVVPNASCDLVFLPHR